MPLTRFRPVILLLSGNLLGAAVGGVFFLVALQRFSLDDMGRYAVAISFQWVTFGVIGTGLSIATIRFARDHFAANDREGAAGVVGLAATAVVGMTVVLAATSYGVLAWIQPVLHWNPVIGMLAVLWAGARALLDTLRSSLLAQQDFWRTAILSVASAMTGLAALAVVMLTGEFTVTRILIAHTLGLFLGALVSVPLLGHARTDFVRSINARALLSYARWPAISEMLRLSQTNLGAPMLVALVGSTQAGLFGLGRYPAYVFDVIAVSLYQFWLARAVDVGDRNAMRGYVRRQIRWAVLLGIGMVALSIVIQPLLPLLDAELATAGPLFIVSTCDFAILLLIRPIETVFHGLRLPRVELLQRSIGLPVLLIMALLMVPRWGAMGMAVAQVATSVISFIFGSFLVRRALAPEVAP